MALFIPILYQMICTYSVLVATPARMVRLQDTGCSDSPVGFYSNNSGPHCNAKCVTFSSQPGIQVAARKMIECSLCEVTAGLALLPSPTRDLCAIVFHYSPDRPARMLGQFSNLFVVWVKEHLEK